MKALSLTPPWHVAILEMGKRVENRIAWSNCSYRGSVLLHAAKGLGTRAAFHGVVEKLCDLGAREALIDQIAIDARGKRAGVWLPAPTLQRGGIVGRAQIVDVVRGEADWDRWVHVGSGLRSKDARAAQRRWWFGGFALVLDEVEPLPFVPWKGALGLFDVPDDYATRATA